jgi:hypothetical protein
MTISCKPRVKVLSLLDVLLGMKALFLVLLLGIIGIAQAENQSLWSRGVSGQSLDKNDPAFRFVLTFVRQEPSHLLGICAYENYSVRGSSPRVAIIEGIKTADGVFWPDLKLEVSNELSGIWTEVGKSATNGQRVAIRVKPKNINMGLTANLDRFQPLIGKYKFGKLTLKTGEAAVFELSLLSPPTRAAERK